MKKLYASLALVCVSAFVSAQCFVQVICQPTTCYGACDGSATAYGNGAPPFSYLWSPMGGNDSTATGLCPGTYTVTLTDNNGCTATATCTVTTPPQLQAIITNVVNPSCPTCCDGSMGASASGGTPAYAYTWTGPNGFSSGIGNITNLCPGSYTLCVTDMNGCTSCDTVSISFPTQVNQTGSSASQLIVTPIDNGQLSIYATFATAQPGEIVVTNVMGQDIVKHQFGVSTSVSKTIDLSNQPAGMYFVSVATSSGVKTVRIMR